MKLKFGDRKLPLGLTIFFILIGSIIVSYFLYHNEIILNFIVRFLSICQPVIIGFIIAYLLTPIVNFQETKLYYPLMTKLKYAPGAKAKKWVRAGTILITYIIVIAFFYSFYQLLSSQIIESLQNITSQFPSYMKNFNTWISELLKNNPEVEETVTTYFNDFLKEINNWLSDSLLPNVNTTMKSISTNFLGILSGVFGILKWIYNLLVGAIISIYVLSSKEVFCGKSKKLLYSVFDSKKANNLISVFRYIHKTFNGFLAGKIIDSIIIGIICYISLLLLNIPYTALISVIVGITNIIPFFGPYLGAIPSTLILLLVDPIKALYFLIFILILQQFDGNILGPKILGNSTGLSGFWVICSITVFGGFFGVIGMLIGVPTVAVIIAGINYFIDKRLSLKKMPLDTESYFNVDQISGETFVFKSTDPLPKNGLSKRKKDMSSKEEKNNRNSEPLTEDYKSKEMNEKNVEKIDNLTNEENAPSNLQNNFLEIELEEDEIDGIE